MYHDTPQPDHAHQAGQSSLRVGARSGASRSGIVIAAIGLQLLLCTVASAAHACSGTLDRLETSVAHAIRDMVDRQVSVERSMNISQVGYRLVDCDLAISPGLDYFCPSFDQLAPRWYANLPPPTR